MVLLHGVGSTWRVWAPVLPALEARHRVLAPDLPGFGAAPPLPGGRTPSVPALADAVERLMDAHGMPDAHLVGNSMGGWAALELARRGRGRSVVAVSPAGLGTPAEAALARRSLGAARALARLVAPAADAALRPALGRRLLLWPMFARPERLTPAAAADAVRAFARAPAFDAAADWMRDHALEGADAIACPVLVLWGTRDRLLWPWQGPRLERRLRRGVLRPLPGLGHVPMSDDPARVAGEVLAWAAAAEDARRLTPT